MDPVLLFVVCARKRVTSLDYVAKCVQLCGEPAHVVDTFTASLESGSLARPFWDTAAALARRGGDGALPTAFAKTVWIDTDRAAEGLRIDRDWRAWLKSRQHVVETIDELERHIPPQPESREPSSILTASLASPAPPPAPPGEARPTDNSTPSVHDIAATLTDNARSVLEALHEVGATSRANAAKKTDVEDRSGVTGNSLRTALSSLRKAPESCIESAGSVAGGIWLTTFGVAVAQCVVDEESTNVARNDARTNHAATRKDRASLRVR